MTPPQRVVMREIYPYVFLGHLLITAGVCSACVPLQCLRCNDTVKIPADCYPLCSDITAQCINVTWPPDIPPNCKKDFQVFVNTTVSTVDEGDDINLTCVHNFPYMNLTIGWKINGKEILEGQNKSELVLKKVLSDNSGQYTCLVNSPCGIYESSPCSVTVNNQSVLLLMICGFSALVLVVIMGLIIKFKLKRDNAKHKERMKLRAQAGQSGGPTPFTPRES